MGTPLDIISISSVNCVIIGQPQIKITCRTDCCYNLHNKCNKNVTDWFTDKLHFDNTNFFEKS